VEDLFETREHELNRHVRSGPPGRAGSEVVGIPRALLFYELLPFWSVFFNELGIPYALSDVTTRDTIEAGSALCPSSPCLPLKVAYGHCANLIDRGITRIFVPSIASLGFRTVRERLSHVCPSVQAWPFIARSLFPPHITFLAPRVQFASPDLLSRDMLHFGKTLGRGRKHVQRALDRALDAQREFNEALLSAGRRLRSEKRNGQKQVVVLGRPYLLCDAQFRMRLNKLLLPLGVRIIPWDIFDEPEMSCAQLGGMYWYYGKRFLQLAEVIREQPATAVILLSSFGCGSDSFLVHFLRRNFAGVPLLELEIDEHNEWTGVQTRIEAFIESLGDLSGARSAPPTPRGRASLDGLRSYRLMIPRMSDHAFAFAAAFRSAGIDAEVLPLPDGESIDLGREAIAGQECFPCVSVTGDMLRHLRGPGSRSGGSAFFMISGDGPCRLGQYPYLQRLILDGNGFRDVPIFDASQDTEFYSRLEAVSPDFKRKVWQGTVSVDLLYRKWRETRPYAADRECIDSVYREELSRLTGCLQMNGRLPSQLRKSFRRLERERGADPGDRPVIAVLGENYMRCNPTANAGIENTLEDLGAEIWLPSLYEWVFYTNWTARLHCRYEKRYSEFIRLGVVDFMQHLYEKQLRMAVDGRLRSPCSPPVYDLFRLASPYVPRTLEGETLLSIGRTIDYHRRGVAGVIHVVPFGCIVGSIVDAMCDRVSEDLGGFPVVTLHTDNRGDHLSRPELESFWLRATSWHERRAR